MKRLPLLALLLLPALAPAQVVIQDHATGAPLASPLLLPDVAVNDFEQQAIDIVNQGSQSVTIGAGVTGLYYSLCCGSSFVLAPNGKHTLTLKIAPAATGYLTGSLQVDGAVTVFLFTRSLAAASLFLQTAGGYTQAFEGTPAELTLPSGQPLTAALRNNSSGPVIVKAISASGDWSIQTLPALPLTLQAGQEAALVLVAAKSAATPNGTIQIDQWTYTIGAHPPSANVRIDAPTAPVASGQQVSVSVHFDQAPTSASGGTLTLTLNATGSGVALTDPAVLFPSTGSNTVTFTSVPGQTAATFGGKSSVTFQTGTTSGVLQLDAKWGFSSDEVKLGVTPAPIGIETVMAQRASNTVSVIVTGFDNTRSAGRMSFSFFDSQGAFIGSPVTADFTDGFQTYFQGTSNEGGLFKMTVQFPVVGKTSAISSVRLDLTNQAGDAQSSVTPFQ